MIQWNTWPCTSGPQKWPWYWRWSPYRGQKQWYDVQALSGHDIISILQISLVLEHWVLHVTFKLYTETTTHACAVSHAIFKRKRNLEYKQALNTRTIQARAPFWNTAWNTWSIGSSELLLTWHIIAMQRGSSRETCCQFAVRDGGMDWLTSLRHKYSLHLLGYLFPTCRLCLYHFVWSLYQTMYAIYAC